MRLGVLGTLLVVDDAGSERVITAPRQRTLLAALLVHANRVVPIEELAGFVWDGAPPAGAARTLRSYVMRLRQTLGPGVSARILTRAPGYVFQASEDELDLLSFRARGRTAAEALRAQAWPDAAGILAEALDLWRGAALADVESDRLRREHVEYLEQERLQAAEWRTEAELGLGHHVRLLPQLRAAAVEHPLREHGQAQLMLALYRSGRVAEALEAYQQARRALVGELGVEPGQELQALQRRILDGDPLLAQPAASAPVAEAATLGYRHSLPPDTAAFTGRDAELELITASVTGAEPGGVVAIRAIGGMPGVGKTALAVHAAHRLTVAFTDRQLFVDLHGHTQGRDPVSAEDALAGLLAAAGVDARFLPADLAGRAALWRDKMTGQRALLVLDNAASSAQVAPLLPGDGCLVLVTSRRHLADLPGAVIPVSVDTLPPGQARAMFIRLASRAADQDPARIDELTALAGHLPLAVSLLARVYARHPSWSLADLIAETRGSLLTLAAEHASVAAAFDVSWRHLRPAAQGFLALLGLHPGTSVDGYAAAAMAGLPAAVAADLLDELHREGLLTETGYRRYQMHDLIRSYAGAQATGTLAASERQAALDRLLRYYTRAAARAGALVSGRAGREDERAGAGPQLPGLADGAEALAWSRAERANLLACLDHATAAGRESDIVALTSASARLLRHDGPWAEAEARHTAAAEAARRLGDDAQLARALLDLGVVRRLAGDYRGAGDVLTTALGIHQGLGDRPSLAAVLLELAYVRMLVDDYPAAARSAEQSLELYRETGDRLDQAGALILLGSIRRMTDDAPAAFSALTLALAICSDLGDRSGQAHALRELGDVHRLTGDYPAAQANLTEALSLSRELDDRLGQANALTWLGGVRGVTGDYPSALAGLEQALTIQQALDNKNGQANALVLLGDIRQATGDYQAAARDLEQALLLFRDLGSPGGQANVLNWLGNLRRASGDYPGAAANLAEALDLCRDVGDRGGQATALNGIGELRRAQGEIASAEASHREALDLSRQIASPWDEAHALAGLARCARATGDLPGATTLLTQAHEIFHRMGAAETPEIAAELAAIPATG